MLWEHEEEPDEPESVESELLHLLLKYLVPVLVLPWPAGSLALPPQPPQAFKPSPTMSAAAAAAAAPKTLGEAFSEPSTVKKKSGYDVPWVERYRPQKLADVVGNEETLVRLSAIARDGNMPNLILSGPPGTGKVRSCSCINDSWVIIIV